MAENFFEFLFQSRAPQVFTNDFSLRIYEEVLGYCLHTILNCHCIFPEMQVRQLGPEQTLTWRGLNDLPYGIYTLELSQGEDELKMRLVKRI